MSPFVPLFVGFALLLANAVVALPAADEVLSLPGWTDALPSRHFSGFVPNDDGAMLHYYWVFPEDVDPTIAPVIFWTNGGPGCSSLEGWAYELGPFKFMYWNTTEAAGINGYNGTAPFVRNPYSWSKTAHVVFVENPPGVGFSYRTDANDFAINDTANALSNYNGLVHLFSDKFPEYVGNGMYLAGESYAGIYVPMLANEILLEGQKEGRPLLLYPAFRGIVVGNGVTDNTYDNNFATSTGLFAVNHGLMITPEFQKVVVDCEVDGSTNEQCLGLWDTFADQFNDLNPYSFAGWCYNPTSQMSTTKVGGAAHGRRKYRRAHRGGFGNAKERVAMLQSAAQEQQRATDGVPHNADADTTLDCGDEVYLDRYLSRADVRAALNIPADFVGTYRVCYNIPYTPNIDTVVDVYNLLMQHNRTVVVYNGNMDMVVPYTGTFQWMYRSTNWVLARGNAPWVFVDSERPDYGLQTGGQAFQFVSPPSSTTSNQASATAVVGDEPSITGGVWMVLVNGAGHMVPEDRPAAAFELISRILSEKMFPEATLLPKTAPFSAPDVAAVAYGVGGINGSTPPAPQSFWEEWKYLIIGLLAGAGAAQLWCTVALCCILRKRRRSPLFAMGKDEQSLYASPDRYM